MEAAHDYFFIDLQHYNIFYQVLFSYILEWDGGVRFKKHCDKIGLPAQPCL